jgi:transposase-like protein
MIENALVEAIELLKRFSEADAEKALAALRIIKSDSDNAKKLIVPCCVYCGSSNVVRNGNKRGKQSYLCRDCSKSFVETTGTAFFNSHHGEAVWKQVIRDTVDGTSIDKTADRLCLNHATVFNMRHKILFCLEREDLNNPTQLDGVCELDETYILENYKGKKLPPDFWRKARKHGAVAEKPGLSKEYVCICTGVSRDGGNVCRATNRATVGKDAIGNVFGTRVSCKSLALSDNAKGYDILEEEGKCAVFRAGRNEESFFNLNTVNGFHSFIKERNRGARGFGTKFLNRYNALFSKVFRAAKAVADDIYELLADKNGRSCTNRKSQTVELLSI